MENSIRLIIAAHLLIQVASCAFMERLLPGTFTLNSPVQLDRIDEKKAIVRYDFGPLIHTDGKQLADEAIQDFCGPRNFRIITEGERINANRSRTKTLIVECLESYELHINY